MMLNENVYDHLDLSISRAGQDIRYALDDSKLRATRLGS
jgi:dTDP-D-glucose 4,6-dehydratase